MPNFASRHRLMSKSHYSNILYTMKQLQLTIYATTMHVCYSLVMSVLVLVGLDVSVAWDGVVSYAVHVMALEE